MKLIELSGLRFARLLVLEQAESRGGAAYWRCQCDCGRETEVTSARLRTGKTRSCGCLRAETTGSQFFQHGMTNTKSHGVWRGVLRRCYDKTDRSYPRYGGRGITVCHRWRVSFLAFHQDMGDPPPGLTLERKKTNGPYSKGNCVWATQKEQQNNRSNNHQIAFRGEIKNLGQWADSLGISRSTIHRRLKRGMSTDEALGFKEKVK